MQVVDDFGNRGVVVVDLAEHYFHDSFVAEDIGFDLAEVDETVAGYLDYPFAASAAVGYYTSEGRHLRRQEQPLAALR